MTRRAPHHVRAVRRGRARRHDARRGSIILEAILATVLLGMIGATLAAAASFMTMSQRRSEQRLAAAELANRLMLQYIDNQDAMPSDSLPVEYNADLFRWTMDVQPVRIEMVNPTETQNARDVGGINFDRIKLVAIRVWLGEDSGGSRGYTTEVPNAFVSRLIDPLAFNNPDSLQTMLEEPGGLERLFQRLMELEDGGSQ
jgi:type II secretory pathway pseudopilin PulG